MAQYEDKVLHELDGIKEYDNPMPGWLMAIWWGSLIFPAAYLIFYALSFGEGTMEAEYRGADARRRSPRSQAYFDANPLVPPSPAELLAGAKNAAVLDVGASRFARSCASCHGDAGAGPDRPEPHRRSLDPRRLGRADLPDGRQGLAGEGHAAVGPRAEARGTVGAGLVRAEPAGLEPAEPAGRGDPRATRSRGCRSRITEGADDAARVTSASSTSRREEDLLYSLSADGKRQFMHPVVRKGRYWKIRRAIAYGAVGAVLRAAAHPGRRASRRSRSTSRPRRSHVFGAHVPSRPTTCCWPRSASASSSRCSSSARRSAACGAASRCPQTVYLEFLFRPIEALARGRADQPAAAEQGAVEPARRSRIKAAKWAIWTVARAADGRRPSSPTSPAGRPLAARPRHRAARRGRARCSRWRCSPALILFDFGWFRDQMCTIACPYGRLQNVLADQDTILVAYDETRGDPQGAAEGPRRRRARRRLHRLRRLRERLPDRHRHPARPAGRVHRHGAVRRRLRRGDAQAGQADRPHQVHVGARAAGRRPAPVAAAQPRLPGADDRGLGHARRRWSSRAPTRWSRSCAAAARPYRHAADRRGRQPAAHPLHEPARPRRSASRSRSSSPQGATLVLSESPIVVEPEQVVTVNAVDHGAAQRLRRRPGDRPLPRHAPIAGFRKEVEFLLLGPFGQHREERR